MSIDDCTASILARMQTFPRTQALLVAISGIDASGKGFLTEQLAKALERQHFRVAVIHGDCWLHLPGRRFGSRNPGLHFYENAFRFDSMFRDLVLPLRERRSVHLTMDWTDETATGYRPFTYEFHDVDVILLECIFLLKKELCDYYDLSLWIECTFETALERALNRAQEGLPPEATRRAYQDIFFPAQRIHLARDGPREAASAILSNDPLGGTLWRNPF